MTEQPFFIEWTGKVIEFPVPESDQSLFYALEEVIGDKNDQSSAIDYYNQPCPSAAYGAFLCRNTRNPNDVAVLKLILQIPYAGSEFAIHAERARQATDKLPYYASLDIEACQTLTRNRCTSTPLIRQYRIAEQDDSGIVPNGFSHYILLDKAPGVQLEDVFWTSLPDERGVIRDAFKHAWLECHRAGIHPQQLGLSHLFWDAVAKKVYITGFRESRPSTPEDTWKDINWIAWDLAIPPRSYRWEEETNPHPDMSEWKL